MNARKIIFGFAIQQRAFCFWLLLAMNCSAARWPEVNSQSFKSALDYACAYTLFSSIDVNCWSSLCGDAYKLTQAMHKKRGTNVRVDILGRKGDDGVLRVFAFFPDFKFGNETFVLNFLQTNREYLFLGQTFEPDFVRFDFRDQIDVSLPKDCRLLVRSEFQPKADEIIRLRRWCREFLDGYPNQKDKTNHFFMEPSSMRYLSTKSFYWIEGQKIIRAEPFFHPGREGVQWKIVHDFNQQQFHRPPEGNLDDYGRFLDRMNQEVSKHVVDGMLLTIMSDKTGR